MGKSAPGHLHELLWGPRSAAVGGRSPAAHSGAWEERRREASVSQRTFCRFPGRHPERRALSFPSLGRAGSPVLARADFPGTSLHLPSKRFLGKGLCYKLSTAEPRVSPLQSSPRFSWDSRALARADLRDPSAQRGRGHRSLSCAPATPWPFPKKACAPMTQSLCSLCRYLLNELADVGRARMIHSAETALQDPNRAVCPIRREAALT